MDHSGGLWAVVLVDEAYAQTVDFDGIDAPPEQGIRCRQWRSSRWAMQLLWNTACSAHGVDTHALDFRKEPSGRPYLVNPAGIRVPVALAHTVGMGAAAQSGRHSLLGIGVDVERYSDRFLRVVSRVSCIDEIQKVQSCLQGGNEAEAAVLIWVIKEACYKSALNQDGLFGINQLITSLEKKESSYALEKQLWTGWVESNNSELSERIEFEAGSFKHDQSLWYWAVAWRKG
jgi:phosphopantetheinyl transferase